MALIGDMVPRRLSGERICYGMKSIAITLLALANLCCAQETTESQPAATNVLVHRPISPL